MKKAIIIPVYLKFRFPEELPPLEGLRLAKRAIKSLRVLRDQTFTLILPVCFDLPENRKGSLYELDQIVRDEVRALGREKILIFSSFHLPELKEYLTQKNFRDFNSLIDLKGFPKIRNTGLLLAQVLLLDPGYFLRKSVYPKAILTSLSLSLDYLARGQWVKAKECITPIGLLLHKRRGWGDYLRFKRDWEMVMEKIQEEGMDEILEGCWV